MLGKLAIEVSLAKPPSENKKKERRDKHNRMMRGYVMLNLDLI